MDSLAGKIALVTGSSRGIGRAVALAFAREGSNVVVNYRNRAAEAEAVQAEILQMGRRCLCVQADVSIKGNVEKLIGETQDLLGTVEILINNAGIGRVQAIEAIRE